MISKAFELLSENRMLAVAIVLSAILHIVFFSNLLFKAGQPQATNTSLTVTLTKLDDAKPLEVSPKPVIKSAQNKVIQPDVKLIPKTQSPVAPATPQPSVSKPITTATQPMQEIETQTTSDTNLAEGVFHAPSTPVIKVSPNTPSIRQAPSSYQYVETEFETIQTTHPTGADTSNNPENVSVTSTITFIKQAEKNTYQLTSTIQKNNRVDSTHISSEGEITAFGLRPNHYARINNGVDGSNASYADFYWADGTVEEYDAKNKISKKLTAGTQDELSYLYQFMFNPPTLQENISPSPNNQHSSPSELQRDTNPYTYLGEDLLQTNLGELKTIHILKKDNLLEDTELWLAIEYNYLPVKIRKIDKNGLITDQIVTKISLSPPQNGNNP